MNNNRQTLTGKDKKLMEKLNDISLPLGYTFFKDFMSKNGLNFDFLSKYDVKSIKYGEEYIVFVKRHSDEKAFMISPGDILNMANIQTLDGNFDGLLNNCYTSDDFVISEGEEECSEGLYIYSLINNQYRYIFPFINTSLPKIVDVDSRIILDNRKGISYFYPRVHYFKVCGNEFVYIVRNDRACIYNTDGGKVGEFDMFCVIDGDLFATIKKNGRYNYYSFERMQVLFDKWFEDCDDSEFVNNEWLFKVKENGEYKILNIGGRNISNKYEDVLEKWIEDLKKRSHQ